MSTGATGEKFDPQATTSGVWIPALARLKAPHCHAPHAAPAAALVAARVRIGSICRRL
jgi:hypothetical protein